MSRCPECGCNWDGLEALIREWREKENDPNKIPGSAVLDGEDCAQQLHFVAYGKPAEEYQADESTSQT